LVPEGDVTPGSLDVSAPHRIAAIEYSALLLAALLAALAGAVALAPIYGRHLARRRDDAVVIDALGMLPRQRFLAGWLPGIAAAVTAGGLAVVVAIALSPLFPLGAARQTDLDAGLHADWSVLASGAMAVASVVAGLTALSAW